MADPVSWLQIEPGWTVVASDGSKVGTVTEVTGDKQVDVFDGLAVSPEGQGPVRYVPGERVGAIYPGEVTLTMTALEAAQLDEFKEPPPETVIRPPGPTIGSRLANWFRGRR